MSELPDRPSLDSLRKQAKSLLRDVRARESTALQRVETHHPNLDRFSSLRDAKLVVAREYGIRSWAELVHSVETAHDVARSLDEQATMFADLACLHYSGKEDVRHRERAARLLQERPDLVTANVYAAAAASDVVEIERWLQREPDCVNRPGGPRDWPPLMYVTYSRVPENSPERDGVATTRLLLDAGADPCFYIDGSTAIGGWRWYPLTGAIGEGEAGLVQQPPHPRARELADLLLDAGADPNDSQGLYNSMFTPGNEWLELLLSRGLTSTHRTDPDGDSPITTLNYQLSPAIQRGFTERVELLLNHGADAANRDEWYGGGTHVEEALKAGEGGILDFLVQHGAPEPELTPDDRYRIAVMQGDEAEARRCLETDPDLSDQTDLLVTAAHHGRLEAVRLLIDLGTDPNQQAANGRGAMHEAAWAGQENVVRLLLNRNARCDIRTEAHGGTPAGYANHAGRLDLRDTILEHSNDAFDLVRFGKHDRLRNILASEPSQATAVLPDGRTPLHSLQSNEGDSAVVLDLLLESGADIHAEAEGEVTPLSSALERGDESAADLLRERGASR